MPVAGNCRSREAGFLTPCPDWDNVNRPHEPDSMAMRVQPGHVRHRMGAEGSFELLDRMEMFLRFDPGFATASRGQPSDHTVTSAAGRCPWITERVCHARVAVRSRSDSSVTDDCHFRWSAHSLITGMVLPSPHPWPQQGVNDDSTMARLVVVGGSRGRCDGDLRVSYPLAVCSVYAVFVPVDSHQLTVSAGLYSS